MLELLFLLLPIAAGYGWYMGRRSVRQDTQQQSNQFSRQYVAGLNYLLSDESDKAVDLFIQLLEVDSETIETHLSSATCSVSGARSIAPSRSTRTWSPAS